MLDGATSKLLLLTPPLLFTTSQLPSRIPCHHLTAFSPTLQLLAPPLTYSLESPAKPHTCTLGTRTKQAQQHTTQALLLRLTGLHVDIKKHAQPGGGGAACACARERGSLVQSSTLTHVTKSKEIRRVEKNLRRVGVYCNGCSRILERLL